MGPSDVSPDVVGPSGTAAQTHTEQERRDACRERVDEMYDKRDRALIYTSNPSVNSPQSANYVEGITSRGLPAQFEYDRTVNDCVRDNGRQLGTSDTQVPMPAASTPAARGH